MLTKCSQLNVNAAAASASSSYFSASTALHRYYLVPPTLSASIEKKREIDTETENETETETLWFLSCLHMAKMQYLAGF